MLPKLTPGSSMTWMLEVLDPNFTAQPLLGWRVEAEMVAARDGYSSQSTIIYASSLSCPYFVRQASRNVIRLKLQ
jgi:hypothetical protein